MYSVISESIDLLSGNVFDWGAKEVVKLMEGKEEFTFQKAMDVVPGIPKLNK